MTTKNSVDMDVVVAKIISLVILTVLTVVFGLLPCRLMQYFAKTIFRRKKVLDYTLSSMKCFSGGVFLGTCFLHLIPETRSKVNSILHQSNSHSSYPVSELLTIAGFFGVIFTEYAIKTLYRKLQEMTRHRPNTEWLSVENMATMNNSNPQLKIEEVDIETQSLSSIPAAEQDKECPNEITILAPTPELEEERKESLELDIEPVPLQDMEVKHMVKELNRGGDSSKDQMRSVLFITALSFHGVFEGMTLGLQTLETDVWVLCFAVCVHRTILAFGLGLQRMRNADGPSALVFSISSFAVLAALGVIIGLGISTGAQLYSDVSVPNAILQSLATGTLLYIVFFDILFREIDGHRDAKKMSCAFVGFATMAVIFAVSRQ